ncbi:uncharacterized protein METZ01_LOCUS470055, partial [marine metagenome]
MLMLSIATVHQVLRLRGTGANG